MITLLLCGMLLFSGNDGSYLIVVNQDVPLTSISKRQLRALYLGKIDRIGRTRLMPVWLHANHPRQKQFNRFLFGARFNVANYWYEQKVRGGPRPPRPVNDEAFLLVYVARNPGFIGFLPVDMASDASRMGVKILPLQE